MAAVGLVFPHFVPTQASPKIASWQVRRLVPAEAQEWRNGEDIVLHWGDAGVTVDAQAIAKAVREDQAQSLFGRSWVHYCEQRHEVTFGVDRLGIFPILLAQRTDSSLLAGNPCMMAQLLGQHAQVSLEAGLEVIAFGQLLGNRSTLNGVSHLHAGTVGTIDASGTFYIRHALPFIPERRIESTPQQVEDALAATVDQCLQAHPSAMILVDDSIETRLLLAAALATGHRPTLIAVGLPGSNRLKMADALAKASGAKLYQGVLSNSHFLSACHTVSRLSGGECPVTLEHPLIHPELIAQTRGRVLITSLGRRWMQDEKTTTPGYELLDQNHPISLEQAETLAIRRLFSPGFTEFMQAFPQLHLTLQQYLSRRLEVYQASTQDTASFYQTLLLGEQIRRAGVAQEFLSTPDYARVHPLLHPQLLQVICGLKTKAFANQQFQQQAIARLSPNLAEIPWETSPLNWSGRFVTDGLEPTWLNRWVDKMLPQLREILLHHGVGETGIANGMNVLFNSPGRLVFLSRLATYTAWHDFVTTRHSVQPLAA